MDLKFYLSLFMRRLHYFLLLLALGSGIGLTLASVLPPVYVARAVLIVESEQIPDDLAATTVQTEATEQLQIIQQRILTRARLLEMANQLRIYASTDNGAFNRMSADEIVEDLRERIQIVTVGGGTRTQAQATIVTVSFEAPTAAMSAAVTNQVVTLMLQENISIRTTVAAQTLDFFDEEVQQLDQRLTELGAEILAFQEENLNALPDSLDFRRSQQAAAQERLLQLNREEATLRDRRNRLVTLFETTGRVTTIDTAAPPQTAEARQLQALRDELTGALAVLAPQNPRVRMLEARIAGLEATVAAQGAGPDTRLSAAGAQLSAYEIQLADLDGQLEFIAEQIEQITAMMEELRVSIEATPGNAGRLATMQRNYSNIQLQYNQAVANRALAETGDMIEALAKGQRISVIEQATPPEKPESPNRVLIAAGGIGTGFLLGLGLIVLLEVTNSAIRRPEDLITKLGITPFGTLPHYRTKWEIRRRGLVIATAFLIAIAAVPAGLWWVHTQITPLDLLLERVVARITR